MSDLRIIDVKRSVFEDNNADADRLRQELKDKHVFLLNLMSSPGAGKTTALKALTKELKNKLKIGIMEADIDSDVDTRMMLESGVDAIQIHTGGMCHLDADMTILSVPEGHDKPLKYPLMYETCDLLVVNKIDTLSCFDFDKEKVVEYAKLRNPNIHIIFASAKTGEGIPELAKWITDQVSEWNN